MNSAEPATAPATLLYVEDEENDVFFLRRAFGRAEVAVNLQAVSDGEKAVAYLSGLPPYAERELPRLVLLDLNLPLRSGFEVLEWLRSRAEFAEIPVVVFSSSGRPEDRNRARELGASDYFLKPTSGALLLEVVQELRGRWLTAGNGVAGRGGVFSADQTAN